MTSGLGEAILPHMLTQLQLRNFRCFESLRVDPGAGFTFFIGGNGEGKTSILEAVCVLLRLQSQRSSSLAPAVRAAAKSFSVRGIFDGHALEFAYGALHRKLTFDEVEQRTAREYLRLARLVSIANIDIELVRSAAEPRRRYLDFLGAQVDPAYRPTLRAFERALRARNALLKSAQPRPREIAAYDAPLLENGARLTAMRASLVERLAAFVTQAHYDISGTTENVAIHFAPGVSGDFAVELEHSREKELRLRQTVVGPHRDDIDLSVDGMPASSFASEGQQRTLALALKIGQARVFASEGAPPVLLIDDIFGELDPTRRRALFAVLPNESQKLVTATSVQWPERAAGPVFRLENRKLRES
jgi:DNA replication and repair protein RecF